MITLSTGQASTLGNYRNLAALTFGERSPAVSFLDQQIAEAPNGAEEAVLAPERQMIGLLIGIHQAKTVPGEEEITRAEIRAGQR